MFVEADARVAYAGTISVRTGKLAAATCRTVVSLAPTEEAGRVQQQTNRACWERRRVTGLGVGRAAS